MRILILTQHFPPEPATRVRDLTRHLALRGHHVFVVTAFPSYKLSPASALPSRRLRLTKVQDGTSVTRVFSVRRGSGIMTRLLSYASFCAISLLVGLPFRRRPDVAYAYHPPLTTGLAAAAYGRLTGVPFLCDVQDLWPEAAVAAGFGREGGPLHRLLRFLEDQVYRRAAVVTVLSRGMHDNLVSKGVSPDKIRVISNWGDADLYASRPSATARAKMGWQNRFVVLIAGNLGLTHGWETVLQAAHKLTAEPRVLFVFLGDGAAKRRLVELASDAKLENVRFLPHAPPRQAARLLNAADATLVHLNAAAGGEFSVPHRIFSSMLCGKPVIAACSGSSADLVANREDPERPCGWVCPPSDPQALARTVLAAAGDQEACRSRGENAVQMAASRFRRDDLLDALQRALSDAAVTTRRAPLLEPR